MGKRESVITFCGVCVYFTLDILWIRFYRISLYWDIGKERHRDHRGRFRLTHQSINDLRVWVLISGQELGDLPVIHPAPDEEIHTDAENVGFGATLSLTDMRTGVAGNLASQGIWS